MKNSILIVKYPIIKNQKFIKYKRKFINCSLLAKYKNGSTSNYEHKYLQYKFHELKIKEKLKLLPWEFCTIFGTLKHKIYL